LARKSRASNLPVAGFVIWTSLLAQAKLAPGGSTTLSVTEISQRRRDDDQACAFGFGKAAQYRSLSKKVDL
jgi:hypothetical protein